MILSVFKSVTRWTVTRNKLLNYLFCFQVITEKQLKECMKIIVDTMKSFDVKKESPRESKL